MDKTAIIIGSTGLTGSALLNILLNSNEYAKIISFVRKATHINHPKLIEYLINFDNIDSYQSLINGDDLFCCLGTTMKKAGNQEEFEKVDLLYPLTFAKIAANNGTKQCLVISSIGANPDSKNFYLRTKGKLEVELRKFPFQSISVFRPSLLLGDRKEFRIAEKLGEYSLKALSVMMLGKLKKYKPIKAKDVAKAMFNISLKNNIGFRIYESDEIVNIAKE